MASSAAQTTNEPGNGLRNDFDMAGRESNHGTDCDVAIVGGGMAGLGAALTLARAGRRVIVIDAGKPRNRFASHVQGYLTRDGMPPSELLAIGRQEVERYGAIIREGEVVEVVAAGKREGEWFVLALADGTRLTARRVMVTTGLRDELPEIEGIAELWGKDVHHCPYCHGYEVRNEPLGVIASGPMSVHLGLLIRHWSENLVYFANETELVDADREKMEARGTRIVLGKVRRLVIAADRLTGVELEDGTVVARTALFVGPRFVAEDSLLARMGAETQTSELGTWVVTDRMGSTTVPGVWAAGNVADLGLQVINAAGAGVMAAAAINGNLIEEDTRDAVAAAAAASTPTRNPTAVTIGAAGAAGAAG
jgi:thioredoxin reductase